MHFEKLLINSFITINFHKMLIMSKVKNFDQKSKTRRAEILSS